MSQGPSFPSQRIGVSQSIVQNGWIQSAHDCSDGGLAVALAECCFSPSIGERDLVGANVQLDEDKLRTDALLFGETPSRVVISASPKDTPNVLSFSKECGLLAADIVQVGGEKLSIRVGRRSKNEVDLPVSRLMERWNNSIEQLLSD